MKNDDERFVLPDIPFKWVLVGIIIGFVLGFFLGKMEVEPLKVGFSDECGVYCGEKNSSVQYELVSGVKQVCYCDARLKDLKKGG